MYSFCILITNHRQLLIHYKQYTARSNIVKNKIIKKQMPNSQYRGIVKTKLGLLPRCHEIFVFRGDSIRPQYFLFLNVNLT